MWFLCVIEMFDFHFNFISGCRVKFEQDDKEFMLTEDVAAYCTTPGGRRRDDMNFYTSGMKIVQIQEQDQSFNSAQVS